MKKIRNVQELNTQLFLKFKKLFKFQSSKKQTKPSPIFRQAQYDQRAVSLSLWKTVGCNNKIND
jgi:hypothetical protein